MSQHTIREELAELLARKLSVRDVDLLLRIDAVPVQTEEIGQDSVPIMVGMLPGAIWFSGNVYFRDTELSDSAPSRQEEVAALIATKLSDSDVKLLLLIGKILEIPEHIPSRDAIVASGQMVAFWDEDVLRIIGITEAGFDMVSKVTIEGPILAIWKEDQLFIRDQGLSVSAMKIALVMAIAEVLHTDHHWQTYFFRIRES